MFKSFSCFGFSLGSSPPPLKTTQEWNRMCRMRGTTAWRPVGVQSRYIRRLRVVDGGRGVGGRCLVNSPPPPAPTLTLSILSLRAQTHNHTDHTLQYAVRLLTSQLNIIQNLWSTHSFQYINTFSCLPFFYLDERGGNIPISQDTPNSGVGIYLERLRPMLCSFGCQIPWDQELGRGDFPILRLVSPKS